MDLTDALRETSDVAREIQKLVEANNVLLFAKSTCQFCLEVERTLLSWGVTFAVVELDSLPSSAMKAAQDALFDMGGFRTVPHLFVEGVSRGGCNDIKTQERNYDFQLYLAKYIQWDKVKTWQEERVRSVGFLYFPDTINANAARVVAIEIVLFSVLCIVFQDMTVQKWAVLALAIDNALRLVGGGGVSVLGMIAALTVSGVRPRLVAGPPKQFAAFCAFFLSTMAAGFYIAGMTLPGLVILAVLSFAAFLEGVFDFCLGCWIFGFLFEYGLVRSDVFRPHINIKLDREWAYDFSHTKRDLPFAENRHVWLPGQDVDTPIDLVRKKRFETE